MATKRISRREFFRLGGLAAGAVILNACAQQTGETPQVITQIVNQTQVVEQTKVVEQVVTATPPPALVTVQGRELPPDAAPLEMQVYREAGAEPKFFDTARDIYSSGATNLGNEPLLRNDENIQTVPALAESWKPGPNAEYWDFVIRKDAVWSDGEPITPDDWIFTFGHLANPALANPWVWFYYDIKGVANYASGTGSAADIGVEKVDDRTVRIYGEHGSIPYLPALMSYQAAVPVPKHVAEKDPEHWADTVESFVSGGPYIPTTWDHNKEIDWELNPKYNGPHKPAIVKVINPILAAGAPEFTPWLNKETDLVHILGPADLAAARADPKLNPLLHFFNNFQTQYVAFDTTKPPLDKLELRMALAKSIDRVIMCSQVLNGTFSPGYTMLPPLFPAYSKELESVQAFDLDGAKKLLTDANIDPTGISLDFYSNGVDQEVQFVAQQWHDNLGINVNIKQVENAVWGDMRAKHQMQVYKGQYEYDYVDPSNLLTSLWRSVSPPEGSAEPWGSPRHGWKSDQYDQLVTQAGMESDTAKRIQEYQDAEKILVNDVAAAFITHQVVFQIWWPWVVGMHPDNTGNVVFRWLDIARFQMYIRNDVEQLKASY